jgi:hypothetical protein
MKPMATFCMEPQLRNDNSAGSTGRKQLSAVGALRHSVGALDSRQPGE